MKLTPRNMKSHMKRKASLSSYQSQPKRKAAGNGAIQKFTKRPGQGEEIKTLDVLFTGAYNAVYTPDTVPLQQLNVNSGTACVQALNLAQQGAGTSQRIGHKISLKSLRLKLCLADNGNNQNEVTHARIMVIYDHNPDGAYPAANSILSNITQANVVQAGQYSDSLNPNFFERMVVLMDEFICLAPFDGGGEGNFAQGYPTENKNFIIDRFIPLKNLETVFGNTANGMATANPMTIAYIQTGALYILGYGDQTAANTSYAFTGSARLRFADN